MDLDECFRKGLVRKADIDEDLIISLIKMSYVKEVAVQKASVDEFNVSAYVCMAYDSLRGILEAICISKGYKVLSHMCIGELLRGMLDDFDYEQFDRARWVRNSNEYYGEDIEFEQGKELINMILNLKRRMAEAYLSKFTK